MLILNPEFLVVGDIEILLLDILAAKCGLS